MCIIGTIGALLFSVRGKEARRAVVDKAEELQGKGGGQEPIGSMKY